MKYLIIDDNPAMRELIRQEVCFDDDYVTECSDGEDAVEAYTKHLPDFVLMDIKMNRVNGIIATKLIREKYHDANIIIITDYDTPAFRSASVSAGAIAFVAKENLFEVKKYIHTFSDKPE